MSSLLVALFALVASSFRTRAALPAEILALPLFKAASISHSRRGVGIQARFSVITSWALPWRLVHGECARAGRGAASRGDADFPGQRSRRNRGLYLRARNHAEDGRLHATESNFGCTCESRPSDRHLS